MKFGDSCPASSAYIFDSYLDTNLHCDVVVGTPGDCTKTFEVHSLGYFNCDTIFYEDVTIGDNCTDDTLTVNSTSNFNCNVNIGDNCADDTLTVNSVANFNCNTNLGDDCGDLITVDGEAIFNCKTSITNCHDFWYGGINWPCPPDGNSVGAGTTGEVLLYVSGALSWYTFEVKEVAICEGGTTTNYNFMVMT